MGWVCALPIELAASRKMLDVRHPSLLLRDEDSNVYTLGRIGQHMLSWPVCQKAALELTLPP